jgi:hypothetical protein
MYRTFYNTSTGKLIISRKMRQELVDARLIQYTDQSYLDIHVMEIDKYKVNLETLELEAVPVLNTTSHWMKQRRNIRLAECDWTQAADSPLSDTKKTAWATYRQQLRDLPTSYPNPTSKDDITWPTQPE